MVKFTEKISIIFFHYFLMLFLITIVKNLVSKNFQNVFISYNLLILNYEVIKKIFYTNRLFISFVN